MVSFVFFLISKMETINIKCESCNKNLSLPKVVFKFGIPNLTCPYCKATFKPFFQDQTEPKMSEDNLESKKTNQSEKAWLEISIENRIVKYYILKMESTVGRKSNTSQSDIQLESTDKTMSRHHFTIKKIEFQGRTQYILKDANSKNHTFIKTKELVQIKSDDEYILQNNDIILAGETIINFKANNYNQDKLGQSTVLIR